MNSLGNSALMVALLGAIAGAFVRRWRTASLVVTSSALVGACVVLVVAFVSDRFDLQVVAAYSRPTAPLLYKIAGVWGGMAGSLVLWSTMSAIAALIVHCRSSVTPGSTERFAVTGDVASGQQRETDGITVRKRGGMPRASADPPVAVLPAVTAIFTIAALFIARPFSLIHDTVGSGTTRAGSGMAPILEHPAMLVHPPLVYAGLIGALVPTALWVQGVELNGRQLRVATRAAWTILLLAMTIGGWWAYAEVGWGGFWAWDPVENASLLPWLALTGFLHAPAWTTERNQIPAGTPLTHQTTPPDRAILGWVLVSAALAMAGSVLARSGSIGSVHAFAESPKIGWWVFAGSIVLAMVVVKHARDSRGSWSRSTARPWRFRVAQVLCAMTIFAVALGTVRPLLAPTIEGERLSVAPRFFAQITAPLALVLLVLIGVAHRSGHGETAHVEATRGRWFDTRTAVALISCSLLSIVAAVSGALSSVVGAIGVIAAILAAGVALARSRPDVPLRARVAHLGLIIMMFGIAGSISSRTDARTLRTDQTTQYAGFDVTLTGVAASPIVDDPDGGAEIQATVSMSGYGESFVARPRLVGHTRQQVVQPEVVVRTGIADVHVALRLADDEGRALIEVSHKPLVIFVWLGAIMMLASQIIDALTATFGRAIAQNLLARSSTGRSSTGRSSTRVL